MARMTDDELRQVVEQEVAESSAWSDSELAADRERNLRYYHGQPIGNEVPGRSQVVSWDVFEVIESAVPSLIEPFFAGDHIGEFEPVEIGDEDYAEQATDYVNWIIKKKNDGFILFNTWAKDAMLSKVGIVRSWWNKTPVIQKKTFAGLTDAQLTRFTDDPKVTILTHDAEPDSDDAAHRQQAQAALATMPPEQAQQVQAMLAQPPQMLHTIEVQIDKGPRGVCIDNVPPESFILSRRAKKVADLNIIGELREYTRSDLVSMGFERERVASLADYESQGMLLMRERVERMQQWVDNPADDTLQPVVMFFGFVRADYDGDGIAEWRRVFMAGNDILENEEVEGHEYSLWSPIMLPHRIIGMALADPVVSIQETKTALTRQYIDSLFLANNPTSYALPGANLDDLLSNRIGRVIRMKNAGDAGPLQTTLVANESLQGIELVNNMREERIGVSRLNQGLDADSLNKTATGAQISLNRDQKREKMMLRVFAETGVKDLFKRVLGLTCQYQDKPATIRLRNEWVEYDPREWSSEMDVNINVGLGTGDKTQTVQFLTMMGAYFQQAAPLGVVTPENVYALGEMLLKAGGIQGGAAKLITDPKNAPAQVPQKSPEQMLAEMELQLEDKRQAGKARDAEIKAQQAKDDLQANTSLKLIDLQLKEKEVRIKEIELGLKDIELRNRMHQEGNAQVENGAPHALDLITALHHKLDQHAMAETHIVRDPATGKASHTVKVFPQTQQEG